MTQSVSVRKCSEEIHTLRQEKQVHFMYSIIQKMYMYITCIYMPYAHVNVVCNIVHVYRCMCVRGFVCVRL